MDCPTTDTPNCAGSVPMFSEIPNVENVSSGSVMEPQLVSTQALCPQFPRARPGLQSEVEVLL